jgi:hypothetical protein
VIEKRQIPVEEEESSNTSLASEENQQNLLQASNLHGETENSDALENDSHFQNLPKNINGSDRLPWETRKPREFDKGFEEHMTKSLSDYPAYKNLMPGDLLVKVRKHISAGKYDFKRRDELFIEWDAYQSLKTIKPAVEEVAPPSSTVDAIAITKEQARIAKEIVMRSARHNAS